MIATVYGKKPVVVAIGSLPCCLSLYFGRHQLFISKAVTFYCIIVDYCGMEINGEEIMASIPQLVS